MSNFTIQLSVTDIERLFAVKRMQGLDMMTGEEFARKILSSALYRMFPGKPERDENGEVVNREVYRGSEG